jgi:Skp family chaperone for outer membrane proteins
MINDQRKMKKVKNMITKDKLTSLTLPAEPFPKKNQTEEPLKDEIEDLKEEATEKLEELEPEDTKTPSEVPEPESGPVGEEVEKEELFNDLVKKYQPKTREDRRKLAEEYARNLHSFLLNKKHKK